MANKKKAIYYPVLEGDVPPFYDNAVKKLNDTYGAKYSIDHAVITNLETHNTQIPLKIAKAENDRQTAQASTVIKQEELSAAKKELLWVFKKIEEAPNFDEQDAEDLGMRRIKTPIDLNKVKPVITKITLLSDKVIFDWIKGELHGIIVESSYDGNTFTFLDKDQKSPFDDTRKNKVENTAETRYYKFRYLYNDQPVGEYTDVIKVVCDIY